jgi:uncharacterized membrane protein YeiB
MVLIGGLHVALLFYDVVAAYGLATVAFVAMLRLPDRKLLRITGWFAPVTFGLYLAIGAGSGPLAAAVPAENPLYALTTRLLGWLVSLTLIGFVLVPAMAGGIWAARRHILEQPEKHQRFLVRTATLGTSSALVGGLPKALIDTLVWSEASAEARAVASAVHATTGFLGGIGAIALIALITIKLTPGRGRIVPAIQALGQRSLSFYLLQSVAFVAVFAPFGGHLGGRVSFAGAAAVALAVWLISIGLADLLRRTGRRGPAEALLRHLTYQKATTTAG